MNSSGRWNTRVVAYLAHRRLLGFALKVEGAELLRFAAFADRRGHRGPLTAELLLQWAWATKRPSALYASRRLGIARGFAQYCSMTEPGTYVPTAGMLGPTKNPSRPSILSLADVRALMDTTSRLRPRAGLRGFTFRTLIGLLWSTGLRISEALHLDDPDVDLLAGVATVTATKFRKSRLVPLHATTARELRSYTLTRNAAVPVRSTLRFFVDDGGHPLTYGNVFGTFLTLKGWLGWGTGRRRGHRGGARLHDLRHSFAVRRLSSWVERHQDVDRNIAALSTYMGHAHVTDTYWYLTAVPELMAATAKRFEAFAAGPGARRWRL